MRDKPTKRKRSASPPDGLRTAKARAPRPDTLTLKKFKETLTEQRSRFSDGKEFPCQQEALERRRSAIESGDLLALFSALQRYRMPVTFGFSFEDASLNPELETEQPVNEVPRWLLDTTMKLLWRGLHGQWPKGRKGQTTEIKRMWEQHKDLVRAAHVLKARDQDVPWENVYAHVAETVEGAGSARAVEEAYSRVARAFDEDPTPYLFLPNPVPDDWHPE